MRFEVLIFLLSAVFLSGCHDHGIGDPVTRAQHQRLEKMRASLIGRESTALRDVIGDQVPDRFIALLVTPGDCGTCLGKSFALTREIEAHADGSAVYVVANNPDVGSYQLSYGYEDMIYYDREDSVRQGFAYYHTPVFLSVDGNTVTDVYFPKTSDDRKEARAFVDKALTP